LFIDVPSNECLRRSQNRKIDPQTGIIYHLEDNPPPENDNKLRDRLQDYQDPDAEYSKLNHNNIIYDENNGSLKKWASGFGHIDEGIQPLSSLMEVRIDQKARKEEMWDKVLRQLQGIVGFKQAQHDLKK
jgi:hypothetical protein